MSSIWTPGGEHRVPRQDIPGPGAEPELTPEEQERLEQAAQEMAAIRAQVAATPPEQVVANHIIGLYELAAIHLGQEQPRLDAARLAIDALGAILDACRGRLGEVEATLTSARSQIQMAFVSVSRQAADQAADQAEGDRSNAAAPTSGEPTAAAQDSPPRGRQEAG